MVRSQSVQQPKQSQPGTVSGPQESMHICDNGVIPIGGGHAFGLYAAAPIGQSATVWAPSRQQTWMLQPSLPAPVLPSKKQSWLTASRLSPGMPVVNEDSSLSSG